MLYVHGVTLPNLLYAVASSSDLSCCYECTSRMFALMLQLGALQP